MKETMNYFMNLSNDVTNFKGETYFFLKVEEIENQDGKFLMFYLLETPKSFSKKWYKSFQTELESFISSNEKYFSFENCKTKEEMKQLFKSMTDEHWLSIFKENDYKNVLRRMRDYRESHKGSLPPFLMMCFALDIKGRFFEEEESKYKKNQKKYNNVLYFTSYNFKTKGKDLLKKWGDEFIEKEKHGFSVQEYVLQNWNAEVVDMYNTLYLSKNKKNILKYIEENKKYFNISSSVEDLMLIEEEEKIIVILKTQGKKNVLVINYIENKEESFILTDNNIISTEDPDLFFIYLSSINTSVLRREFSKISLLKNKYLINKILSNDVLISNKGGIKLLAKSLKPHSINDLNRELAIKKLCEQAPKKIETLFDHWESLFYSSPFDRFGATLARYVGTKYDPARTKPWEQIGTNKGFWELLFEEGFKIENNEYPYRSRSEMKKNSVKIKMSPTELLTRLMGVNEEFDNYEAILEENINYLFIKLFTKQTFEYFDFEYRATYYVSEKTEMGDINIIKELFKKQFKVLNYIKRKIKDESLVLSDSQIDKAKNEILFLLKKTMICRNNGFINEQMKEIFNDYITQAEDINQLNLFSLKFPTLEELKTNSFDYFYRNLYQIENSITILTEKTIKFKRWEFETKKEFLNTKEEIESIYHKVKYLHDQVLIPLNPIINNIKEKSLREEQNQKYTLRKKQIESKLVFSSAKYSIILPSNLEDIVKEGSMLSHCVGGERYLVNATKGVADIVFIRKKNNLAKSYFTVELVEKNKKFIIRQIHGYMNSNPNAELIIFLKEWAEKCPIKKSSIQDHYKALVAYNK